MATRRKNHLPEEKLAILKESLINKTSVSEVCKKHQIQPSQFHLWQTELFESGAQCFDKPRRAKANTSKESKRVKELEEKLSKFNAKLIQKNEVVAELMEEHLKLKKSLGEI